MDHYNTLGVDRNASPDQIKQAYRKLASVHHPDKGGDTAKFQEIQQAYETLGDPAKKAEYDNPHHRMGGFGGGFGSPGPGFPGGFGGMGPGGGFNFSGGINIDEIFGQMFGGQRFNNYPTYKTNLNVTLEQIYNEEEQVLQFQTHAGSQIVRIKIPKAVENGQQMRYDNLIPNAVLIVEFRVYEHNKFQRNGLTLQSEVGISVLDLIVGTTIEFETISGKKFQVTVKPKTQPNTTLRIPNQGLTNGTITGDQLILLKPFIPANINDEIINAIVRSQSN